MNEYERENEEFRELLEAVGRLPQNIEPPRDLWPGIERRLRQRARRPRLIWVGLAAAAVLAGILVGRDYILPSSWVISRLAGLPLVAQKPLAGIGALRVGDAVVTDDSSRAMIQVGAIGQVEVEPRSRLRLLGAKPSDHRLALDVGEIYARVSAPPRLFFVETPSGVAIDLGCAYTLRVDDEGNGFLQVTAGAVEFAWSGKRAVVPINTSIQIRKGFGPCVPVVAGASPAFVAALNAFEFAHQDTALTQVLKLARSDDAISLWHLLSRTVGPDRLAVYDRLTALVPLPEGVDRSAVLHLDQQALDAYWNYLPHSVWLKDLKTKRLTRP